MKTSVKYLKMLVNLLIAAAGLMLLVWVVPKMLMFFLPLVIGWFIAVLANPLVRFLEKRVRIVRKHSSMLIIITAIGLVILVIYLVIAKLGGELVGFIYSLPELYEKLDVQISQIAKNFSGVYTRLPVGVQTALDSLGQQVDSYVGAAVEQIGKPTVTAAGNFAMNLPSYLMGVIFTILFAYFFIADRERIMKFFRENTPEPVLNTVRMVIQSFKQAVGGYFKAQFKIMGVVFLILVLGFMVLGIKYSVLLALVIAFLDFLPFLGTGTALIPWALFQILAQNYRYAIGLFIIYAVSQTVRQMIQPKIVGDTVGMSPVATLIYIYIGYKIKGVIGMIVAVPVGVLLNNLYQMGAFNGILSNIMEIGRDINRFRKL